MYSSIFIGNLLCAPKTLDQLTLASVHVNGEKLYSLARVGNGRFSLSYRVGLNPKIWRALFLVINRKLLRD